MNTEHWTELVGKVHVESFTIGFTRDVIDPGPIQGFVPHRPSAMLHPGISIWVGLQTGLIQEGVIV